MGKGKEVGSASERRSEAHGQGERGGKCIRRESVQSVNEKAP
jgi:hypothetical protein